MGPMTHKDRFINLRIKPPKGVLLYGPPGTGKTLMARACAAQTQSCFLKLAGPQLVQMFIGDGAKLVRDAFALAKEKAPAIIFIDELDAIGTKRFDSEKAGDREVQRTMLELLNQLDGFSSVDDIKVIAATNRIDILDPALLRSGRLDRKIEFPAPTEEARARIMQIHARKMNVDPDVNYEELARSTDDFNGAQCKAVCVEAGMIALRRESVPVEREVIVTKQVAKPYTVEVPRAVPVPAPYKVHPVHEVVEQPIVHHATYTQTHTAHVAAPVAVAHAAPVAVAHAAPAVAAAPIAVAH